MTAEVPVNNEEAPKKELSNIEKVKLMNDLANVCQDEKISKAIRALPNGDKAYELFISSVDKEIAVIMGGKAISEDKNKQVNTSIEQLSSVVAQLHKLMSMLFQTPVVAILNGLYQKMGGEPIQLNQNMMTSAPTQVQPRTVYSQDTLPSASGIRGANGVGSY